jgi:hypothetical protein
MSMSKPYLSRTGNSGHAGSSGTAPADIAGAPRESGESVRMREELIDQELAQSFPASDPPSWVQGTVAPTHP